MITKQYQSDDVKSAAEGHWLRILLQLTILNSAQLDGGNYPCPSCGGADRFNACRKSFGRTGQVYCNKGCGLSGDGFAVLMHLNSWDFATAVDAVGQFLMVDVISSEPGTKRTKIEPKGRPYPDAIASILRGVRQRLPDGVTISDEPTTYHYKDATGAIVGVVLRWDRSDGEKEIRQLSVSSAGWVTTAMAGPRPLYQLPDLLAAEIVFVVEGEKTVQAVESFGLVATTSAGGSSAPAKSDWSVFNGKTVVIIADHDEPGRKYRDKVASLIAEQSPSATIMTADVSEVWPEILETGDCADWSEHFDSQPPEWFRENLETITRPFVTPVAAKPQQVDTDVSEWPELIPFDSVNVTRLDVDSLPDSIRDVVGQVSTATETPAEMALTVCLGAIATATMRKWNVVVEPEFRQPTNLYLCCIMSPGNRKTAVYRRMFEPIRQHEKRVRQAADSEYRVSAADFEIWEKQCSELKTRISKAAGDEATDMRRELDQMLREVPSVAHKPQLVTDDATPESVCTLLSQNQERLGIASAEPEVFDLILGRYSKGPNLGIWLKGHDGDDHSENRRNRPDPIKLDAPLLSLTIMAQPEAISTAGDNRLMRGRGMLDRFLFLQPPSPVGSRQCVSVPIDESVMHDYNRRLNRLLETDIPVDEFGIPSPRLLTLSTDAHVAWKTEQLRIERLMADGEPLSVISGWGSKFAAQIARIAAGLHLMSLPDQSEIQRETMQQAILIGRVIESQTRVVFDAMGRNPAVTSAQKVMRKITDDSLTEVSRREVMRLDRSLDVKDAQVTIDLLTEHGYLMPMQSGNRLGRPSDRYGVNPAVFIA